jgi:hypothetical protein
VAAQPNAGIFFPLDLTVSAFMEQTIALVAQQRQPAVYSERFAVGRGGLMFYGADRIEYSAAPHPTSTASGVAKSLANCPISNLPSTTS